MLFSWGIVSVSSQIEVTRALGTARTVARPADFTSRTLSGGRFEITSTSPVSSAARRDASSGMSLKMTFAIFGLPRKYFGFAFSTTWLFRSQVTSV